jgi:fructose-1,6-bisphosphatase I
MAMIIEQAGGRAVAQGGSILDIQPTGLHERTSVVLGSTDQVDHYLKHTT